MEKKRMGVKVVGIIGAVVMGGIAVRAIVKVVEAKRRDVLLDNMYKELTGNNEEEDDAES